ncbi:hypothetical protein [Paenibacillus periandrae]|uniref:hypothetical protein n=1 Tax=Paenibacillus periandrae TaxID=1761741 RepID=UPI001F090C20|nr:hypothetical protein [Paenibacillus periandrae]
MKSSEKAIAQYDTLQKIVEQLRNGGYECDAGILTKNVAFIALERMAENEK